VVVGAGVDDVEGAGAVVGAAVVEAVTDPACVVPPPQAARASIAAARTNAFRTAGVWRAQTGGAVPRAYGDAVNDKALPFDPIEEARRQWLAHGWGEAAVGMAAVTSVMRAEQIFMSRVEEILKPFELTFARYEALVLLMFSRTGALPLNKIGQRLQVHPASVTNTIDRLESQGLVVRLPHPTDRRATLAEITDAGRDLAAQATEAVNAKAFASTGLTGDDEQALVRILRTLRHGAGDFA